jgi:peptidoglycan/xylan/chitin deacetylase (PgdA/CDA1 family)
MDDYQGRRTLSMVKTQRAAMTLALGILLVLFSTAFAAAPAQTSVGRTASSPTTPEQPQFGWSGWSQVPGNGFTLSGPATTRYNGNDYVFVRGTNDRIYLNIFNGTTWSGWREVPGHGSTLSGPSAALYSVRGATFLGLFVRGTDNKIYTNTFDGTSWSGWSQVPGNGFTIDTPTALAYRIPLNLFVRGTDNKIYTNTFDGINWSGWSQVPGNGSTLSGPSAALHMAIQTVFLDLFVRGTNDRIYVNTLGGTTWSGWREVPGHGLTPSGPAATQLATEPGLTLYLFVRGTDNKIYANTFDGTTWSSWSQVPGNGSTPDAPGAMAFQTSKFAEGQVDLFVRGTNDRIYVNILQTLNPCATPPGVQPVSPVEIDIGNTNRPRIALTFDAGGPSTPTAQILDILARHHVHSTFFITGDWANLNPDLVRRIYNDGHEIGNHTMHHIDLRTLSDAQVCNELNQAEQVLSGITGVTTRPYFRAPYGGRDSRIWNLAANLGYRSVYWTIDTLDWESTATPDSITKRVMDGLRNGVIVLMHAGSNVEAQTLDGLMTKIEQRGYQMVTVTEVLQ